MSSTNIQNAFVDYELTLRVPKEQNDRAKDLHPQIREQVKNALGDLWSFDHLAGSYARKVQTGFLKDIDIIIGINDPEGTYANSATAALELIREAAKGELVDRTRIGVRAVKLTIAGEEFTVDLVPALDDVLGEVKIPRRVLDQGFDDWTSAVPKGQATASSAKNQTCAGMYVPMVRIVKSWNARNGTGAKNLLPSYLVESILFHALTGSKDYGDAMVLFLSSAVTHLAISGGTVLNPGSSSSYVDDLLDEGRRTTALVVAQKSLEQAQTALAESDDASAAKGWQKVFGVAFPDIDVSSSSSASGLLIGAGLAAAAVAAARAPKVQGRSVIPARSHRL